MCAAALALALGAIACGGGSSDGVHDGGDSDGASVGAAGATGQDPRLPATLTPEIEPKVRQIALALGQLVCARADRCCPQYGFAPLTNCAELGAEVFTDSYLANMDSGGDASDYDVVFNDALARWCLDEAASVKDRCVFSAEWLPEWWNVCYDALMITKKGDPPRECYHDESCAAVHGSNFACSYSHCRPKVEVASGASCESMPEDTSIHTCPSTEYCDFHVCKPLGQPGGSCNPDVPSCVDGYGCVYGECVSKVGHGEDCSVTQQCGDRMICRPPSSQSAAQVCIWDHGIGEDCDYDYECPPNVTCVDGRCKPDAMGFCHLPATH